ncbi:alpha/beta hydrolase [Patescibacteria group bacterium]
MKLEYKYAKLPSCTLHYASYGVGEPLIIYPATISDIENWKNLIFFIGKKYKVYFFELPGHGKSEAIKGGFSTDKVVEVVEEFADHLGHKRFSVAGFSFGGILIIKSLKQISSRIDKVILYAPFTTYEAFTMIQKRRRILLLVSRFFKISLTQKFLLWLFHNERLVNTMERLVLRVTGLEKSMNLGPKMLTLRKDTLDVLARQLYEVLTTRDYGVKEKFTNMTIFGMGSKDALMDYEKTLEFMKNHFKNLRIEKFDFTYHQPDKKYSVKELEEKFGYVLDY